MTGELLKLIDDLWANNLAEAATELRRLSDRADELAFIPGRLRGERDHALRSLNAFDRENQRLKKEMASLTEALGGLALEIAVRQEFEQRARAANDDALATWPSRRVLREAFEWLDAQPKIRRETGEQQ